MLKYDDRITGRMDDGTAFIHSETGTEGVGPLTTQRRLPEIISRLAAYEDTGLTPEEINEIKQGKVVGQLIITKKPQKGKRRKDGKK